MAGRLAGVLLALSLIATGAVAAAVSLGIPYLEHRWTYRVVKDAGDDPWPVPAHAELVSFPTADGVILRGWLFEAAAPANGLTVLVLHGNYGDLPSYVPYLSVLRERGFGVLLFSYRGFGLSDGETESEATLTLDAEAAMRWLVTERQRPPRSIAIAGASLGAPVAATLAARSPCRAVALISTVASARDQIPRHLPWMPQLVLDNLGSPFDAAGSAARARCPVAVVHGDADDVVPLAQARRVYDGAPSPKRFMIVPDGDHGLMNVGPEAFLPALAGFFLEPR
jgi:pimeloyl-ACP methyl ester carboxylesterase